VTGPIQRFLEEDHRRLERWLASAQAGDAEAYRAFRAGLLRHIGMEEKILLPEVRRLRHGEPLPAARQLRTDHSLIAALLVPTPTAAILRTLHTVLGEHDALEEGPTGVYLACEQLMGADADAMVHRLHAAPEVPVAKHFDGPQVEEHLARLLAARAAGGRGHR
jgi:hypothetical protein